MARKKSIRAIRKTVLIICEGKRDEAFLKYLRSILTANTENSPKVSIHQAKGKGGNNVITTLLGKLKQGSYSHAIAFTEADVPPDSKHTKLFSTRSPGKKEIIVAIPCLEGLFMEILGIPAHPNTQDCKNAIEALVNNKLYAHTDYHNLFTPDQIVNYAATLNKDDHLNRLLAAYR